MTDRELMQQALDALESCEDVTANVVKVITALRERLAQPEQSAERGEPVAVYVGETWCGSVVRLYEDLPLETPLYTSSQPAQQQEPAIGETNVELGFYSNDASNGQQWELAGAVEMGQLMGNRSHEVTGHSDAEREIALIAGVDEYGPTLDWRKHWVNYPIGTKLYTSPPASKPWVGLDAGDWNKIVYTSEFRAGADWADALLREKNG